MEIQLQILLGELVYGFFWLFFAKYLPFFEGEQVVDMFGTQQKVGHAL